MRSVVQLLVVCLMILASALHAADKPVFQIDLLQLDLKDAQADAIAKGAQTGMVPLSVLLSMIADKSVSVKTLSTVNLNEANNYQSADFRSAYTLFKNGDDLTLVKSAIDVGQSIAITEIRKTDTDQISFQLKFTYNYISESTAHSTLQEAQAFVTASTSTIQSLDGISKHMVQKGSCLGVLMTKRGGEVCALLITAN